jgi:hypothetical protein
MKILLRKEIRSLLFLIALMVVVSMITGCTKYHGNGSTNSASTGGNNTAGPDPLPPYWGGGSGAGSGGGSSSGSGSGGSGTGGAGGGAGTGNGGSGVVDPNIPKAWVQSFIFTGANRAYVTYNDSISLKQDGSYTELYAGQGTMKYKIGNGASTDPTYTFANYFLRPYNFYTFVVFKSPQFESAETILYNDLSAPSSGTSQVRFISLDPLTSTVPVAYKFKNPNEEFLIQNRTYLDNKTDSSFQRFRVVTPGQSTVSFYYKDSSLLSFSNIFDAGKKYTIFSGAAGYVSTNKGQLPIPTYFVTRHN